ncbi:MAG: glycosyltransferase [Firmicutes bacterium]|nr:glycosyltransferase [Bacillota bacterium]
MKILFVIDMYDCATNGTTVSARTFMKELRARGHEVVFIAASEKEEEFKFCVPPWKLWFVKRIMEKQGAMFARVDRAVIAEALEGVDIVHTFLPFKLSQVVNEMAKEKGIPVVAAFHCQPENITYSFWPLRIIPGITSIIYNRFKRLYYRHVKDIHCPSRFIADELTKHGYKARMHVISNGVADMFTPGPANRPEEWGDKFVIACVGRFAPEKKQETLIKAVAASKYRDKIKLVFCGMGQLDDHLKSLAKARKVDASFGFYSRDKLLNILRSSDLYVQPSVAEIECIACIEAFSTGLVPIIADSKLSATRQFAIDKRSLFRTGKYKELARKIEYFMERPEEVKELSAKYIEKGREYPLSKSVGQIEEVYGAMLREKAEEMQKAKECHCEEGLARRSNPEKMQKEENWNKEECGMHAYGVGECCCEDCAFGMDEQPELIGEVPAF